MWEKIKRFFTSIGTYIALAIGGIAGIFFATRRTSSDFDKLRADNAELRKSLNRLREQLDLTQDVNESNKKQYQDIGTELYNIDRIIERTAEDINSERGDVGQLNETNRRLRDWIQKYGAQIESLQSVK